MARARHRRTRRKGPTGGEAASRGGEQRAQRGSAPQRSVLSSANSAVKYGLRRGALLRERSGEAEQALGEAEDALELGRALERQEDVADLARLGPRRVGETRLRQRDVAR